jgi:hypothetical protein
MTVIAAAEVAVCVARLRTIEHPHRPPATAAAHQPRKEGSTTASRLPLGPPLHVGILRDQPLVLFELLPGDVAGWWSRNSTFHAVIGLEWLVVLRARPSTTCVRASFGRTHSRRRRRDVSESSAPCGMPPVATRALPSSLNLSNRRRMTPPMRSSGSISICPISFQNSQAAR